MSISNQVSGVFEECLLAGSVHKGKFTFFLQDWPCYSCKVVNMSQLGCNEVSKRSLTGSIGISTWSSLTSGSRGIEYTSVVKYHIHTACIVIVYQENSVRSTKVPCDCKCRWVL